MMFPIRQPVYLVYHIRKDDDGHRNTMVRSVWATREAAEDSMIGLSKEPNDFHFVSGAPYMLTIPISMADEPDGSMVQ
jgi:hypothetical protein